VQVPCDQRLSLPLPLRAHTLWLQIQKRFRGAIARARVRDERAFAVSVVKIQSTIRRKLQCDHAFRRRFA
jgi:hypothetical protein